MAPGRWSASSKVVETEKVHQLLQSDSAKRMPSPEAGLNMWSLEEELLEPFHTHYNWYHSLGMRTIVAFIMLCSLGGIVLKELVHAVCPLVMGAKGAEKAFGTREHYV